MNKSKELELLKNRMASFEKEYGALLNELTGIVDGLAKGSNSHHAEDFVDEACERFEALFVKLGVDRTEK